jgi:hypothetical protein
MMETLKTERAEIGEAAAPIAKTAATNRETLSQALYQNTAVLSSRKKERIV